MKLSEMQRKVKMLNKNANKEYIGKVYKIPLSLLEKNNRTDFISSCEVLKIDLQENYVEVSYTTNEDELMWDTLSISFFECHILSFKEC